MYFGTTKINEMYFGTSPIIEVWLGATKVWESNPEWTYVIDNVSVNYLPTSQGEKIRANGSNSASVIGRVKSYKNGVLQETKPTVQLSLTTTSPYVKIVDDRLYFNIDDYGLVEMAHSDPFGLTDVKYNYSGVTGNAPVIYVEPNKKVSEERTSYECRMASSVYYLEYNQTSFTVTNRNKGVYTTTYTSGKSKNTTKDMEGYLFRLDENTGLSVLLSTMAANATTTVTVGDNNTGTYPKIFIYRLSNINGTTGYDDFLYVMQKSQNNTTGLQLYWGTNKLTNDYTIETSTFFYLANNGHTSSTTYTYEVDDPNIEITQEGGVILFDNVSSSTDSVVTIKDNNNNSITFRILGA